MIHLNVSVTAPTLESALAGLAHAHRKAADGRSLGRMSDGVYEGTYTVEDVEGGPPSLPGVIE